MIDAVALAQVAGLLPGASAPATTLRDLPPAGWSAGTDAVHDLRAGPWPTAPPTARSP